MNSRRRAAPRKHPPAVFTPLPEPDSGAGVPHTGQGGGSPDLDPERRRALVAEAAYYRAEQRGFEPGRELEDWYAAENDVDALYARGATSARCGT